MSLTFHIHLGLSGEVPVLVNAVFLLLFVTAWLELGVIRHGRQRGSVQAADVGRCRRCPGARTVGAAGISVYD